MAPSAFVARIRGHYIDQFRTFAAQQKEGCTQGAAEVKLQLSADSQMYDRLYCVDFIRKDDGVEIVELQPENILTFDGIDGAFGNASLSITQLQWDDVLVWHDLDEVPADALSRWFGHWFDPDDERADPAAELSGTIHSLLVQPDVLAVDFGTAEPDAFWALLALLEDAGATRIRIGSSRAAADLPA